YSQVLWFGPAIPALATRISTLPKRSIVEFAAAATLDDSETSTASAETRSPAPSCATASESSSLSRSQRETVAPDANKRFAIANPIPCAAPVTIACRFWRSIWFIDSRPKLISAFASSQRKRSIQDLFTRTLFRDQPWLASWRHPGWHRSTGPL